MNHLLQFEFTDRDVVTIKQLELEGYKFNEVVMVDRNGKERFVKIVAPTSNKSAAEPK